MSNFNLEEFCIAAAKDGDDEPLQSYLALLKEDSMMLDCLNAAGVDNWEGYQYTVEEFNARKH